MSARNVPPVVARERARVASLSRSRSVDDPELAQARTELKAARVESYVTRVLNEAPPLTTEQRDRIAALLRFEAAATP